MLVINLYGAPCSGKSTTQADVFRILKQNGVIAEHIPEVAKMLVREQRWSALACQPYLFGETLHQMMVLKDQVEVLVLDSPLMLMNLYAEKSPIVHPHSFFDMVYDFSNQFENLNYFLDRVFPYDTDGRKETEAESDAIARECEGMLHDYSIPFVRMDGDEEAAKMIAEEVLATLRSKKLKKVA